MNTFLSQTGDDLLINDKNKGVGRKTNEGLAEDDEEVVIVQGKRGLSAFVNTDLEENLILVHSS